MQTVFIGLGRMGKNIAEHLLEQGESVIVYNRTREKTDELVKKGATAAYTLSEIPQKAKTGPLVVFLYVTAGEVTDEIIKELGQVLPKDSIIVDGGNSFFKDSQKRYQLVKEKGIHFLDMGTSGGIDGARYGACLMVGGDEGIYQQVEPLLAKIAQKDGYGYFGASGAGHFVKMIHNGIEYGMMGAIAEGFNLVKMSEFKNTDLKKLAKVWAHGSIVSGHLMNMAERAFTREDFEKLPGEVPKGETETEMEWLKTTSIPNPVIQAAREERVETRKKPASPDGSQGGPSFIGRIISALRREFGGHSTAVERQK